MGLGLGWVTDEGIVMASDRRPSTVMRVSDCIAPYCVEGFGDRVRVPAQGRKIDKIRSYVQSKHVKGREGEDRALICSKTGIKPAEYSMLNAFITTSLREYSGNGCPTSMFEGIASLMAPKVHEVNGLQMLVAFLDTKDVPRLYLLDLRKTSRDDEADAPRVLHLECKPIERFVSIGIGKRYVSMPVCTTLDEAVTAARAALKRVNFYDDFSYGRAIWTLTANPGAKRIEQY